jgi:hypothetical protein
MILLCCLGAVWEVRHLLPDRVHPSPLHRPPQGQTQRANHQVATSVADPNPGSGAFLTPGFGIRDPGWVKSQDRDPG